MIASSACRSGADNAPCRVAMQWPQETSLVGCGATIRLSGLKAASEGDMGVIGLQKMEAALGSTEMLRFLRARLNTPIGDGLAAVAIATSSNGSCPGGDGAAGGDHGKSAVRFRSLKGQGIRQRDWYHSNRAGNKAPSLSHCSAAEYADAPAKIYLRAVRYTPTGFVLTHQQRSA
jgi:hypothetical protein